MKILKKYFKRNIWTLFRILKLYRMGNLNPRIIIVISISITFISMFFLFCSIKVSLNSFGNISVLKKTFTIEFNDNSDIEILSDIISSNNLRGFRTESLNACRYMDNTANIERITLIFPRQYDFFNENNLSYHLMEGRFFTKEEIEEGTKVIILSYKEFKQNYSDNSVGDTISYNGTDFTLIGINNAINNSKTILPYNTIRHNIEMKNKKLIQIINSEIIFTEKISTDLIKFISKNYEERTGNDISIRSVYSQVISSIIPYLVIYILLIAVIVFLFLICAKQLFIVIDTLNQAKYNILSKIGLIDVIWKICRIISIEECIIASYIFSLICFYNIAPIVSKAGFQTDLSFKYTLVGFGLLQFIMIPLLQHLNIKNDRLG